MIYDLFFDLCDDLIDDVIDESRPFPTPGSSLRIDDILRFRITDDATYFRETDI